MRTLFWKIFISFWPVVAIFTVIAVLLFGRRAPRPETHWQAVDNNAFAMYAQRLVQTYDAGGEVELYRYLQQFKRTSRGEAYLLDGASNEVAGQILPSQIEELVARAQLEGKSLSAVVEGKEFFAQQIVTNSGTSYVAVVGFPRPADEFPPPPLCNNCFVLFSDSTSRGNEGPGVLGWDWLSRSARFDFTAAKSALPMRPEEGSK